MLSFVADDGQSWGGDVFRPLVVKPANDAPVLADMEADTLSYTAGGGLQILSQTVSVRDEDSPDPCPAPPSGSISEYVRGETRWPMKDRFSKVISTHPRVS